MLFGVSVNKTIALLFSVSTSFGTSCLAATPFLIKPPLLKAGDSVAIIAPAFQFEKNKLDEAVDRLKSLGLKPLYDDTIFHQDGYFAGTEKERSDAINKAIRDDHIKAIFSLKGGYGTANLLDKIDYKYLQKHPKIIIGRSDVTALLIAVYDQAHVVTFYGTSAGAAQSKTTLDYIKSILFQNQNNPILDNHAFNPKSAAYTITPGVVKGSLLGGNLAVLVSMIGTPYFPKNWQGKILFLEDINEDVYVMDRMLGQLKHAGVLDQISGFVFGTCKRCKLGARGSFTLQQVIERHIKPLHIPAFGGAMIGHQEDVYTVPLGSMVELDANKQQIKLIESPTS